MSQIIPEGITRLLLVEGNDEIQFFRSFCEHLNILDSIHILEFGGNKIKKGGATKEKIVDGLLPILTNPNFERFQQIGIVRDADFTGGAFQSVQGAIESANYENLKAGNKNQLPVPQNPFESFGENLKISILILPHENEEGMLENVILNALNDDPVMVCVEEYFKCIDQLDIEVKQDKLAKAQAQILIAQLKHQLTMRVYIEGKKVDEKSTGKDRKRNFLSDLYDMSFWEWERDAFIRIREYLAQLAQ